MFYYLFFIMLPSFFSCLFNSCLMLIITLSCKRTKVFCFPSVIYTKKLCPTFLETSAMFIDYRKIYTHITHDRIYNEALKQVFKHAPKSYYFVPSLFKLLILLSSFTFLIHPLFTLLQKYSKPDIINTSIKSHASLFKATMPSLMPQRNNCFYSPIKSTHCDALDPVPFSFSSLSFRNFLVYWIFLIFPVQVCYLRFYIFICLPMDSFGSLWNPTVFSEWCFKYIKENTEDHKENKLYRNIEKSHIWCFINIFNNENTFKIKES